MINVSSLSKYYGKNHALESITFKAEKGEILGLLGPNGAGKTTAMRILAGYLPPTSGKVTIGGFDVLENSLSARKLIGYLPEVVPLYPDMRVFNYLKFMADLHHVGTVDEKINLVLEQVGMLDRSQSYIHKLSKGMRQRIGLAQAIIHQPEVLILDEPTIGLDPAQIKEVRNLIKSIGKQHTVLLSTHILPEAQQICDRVLIINKGRIIAEDTPEHLQSRMSGSRLVTVRIAGAITTATKAISNIINSTEIDANTLQFENPPDQDLRPKVVYALSEHRIDLLEIFMEKVNLEDIFLQLTHSEPTDSDHKEEIHNSKQEQEGN
ncbi:MAG: ABC transporter ATP-binding protein [Anaerolineaceae bacterium]|nr:ABC transporter ATP-binding protein [Anaerolineaceae bacterium]